MMGEWEIIYIPINRLFSLNEQDIAYSLFLSTWGMGIRLSIDLSPFVNPGCDDWQGGHIVGYFERLA